MKKSVIIGAGFLLALWACSHKTVPAGTETAKTEKKPAAITYSADIRYLVEAKCAPCHLPNKGGFKKNLSNYAAMAESIDDIIARVQSSDSDPKHMPFKNPSLASNQILMLKKWKEEGMPEN